MSQPHAASVALCALALSLAAPPTVAAQAPRQGTPGDSVSLEALTQELAAIVAESPIHGAALALVSDSHPLWVGGFGTSDPDTGEPVTARTLFRANSVSKSFVALAVLGLVEEGLLTLDGTLDELAPDVAFTNQWESTRPVRLVHLLEHTSGFDELHFREYGYGPGDGGLAGALAVNPAPRTTRWPPGTYMTYNNGGYAVIARILEEATGQPFEEVIRSRVLAPLGMEDSGFGLENVDRSRLTRHFTAVDTEEPAEPYPVIVRPAGGLVASAGDMASFVAMLLRRGDPLIGEASVARMETPRTSRAARAGLAVGYGLGSYAAFGEGRTWYGHAGGTPSAWARYAYEPSTGVGYVILLNGAHAPTRRRMEAVIRRFLLQRSPSMAEPPAVPPAADASLTEYTGFYRRHASAWSLTAGLERVLDGRRVTVAGGRLVLGSLLGDAPDTLEALGDDRFRTGNGPGADVAFLRNPQGAVAGLATWDSENIRAGNYEKSSGLAAWAPLLLLVLSIFLMLSALLVIPIRGGIAWARGRRSLEDPWARWLPALAVLSLVGAAMVLGVGVSQSDGLLVLADPGPTAVGFWALTGLFALLSGASLLVTTTRWVRRPGRLTGTYSFLVALSCTVVAIFLATWGVLGLRTWTW